MKKIIYSLVIMIAAGSLFTSCIEQVEPLGIQDMRYAKAEYIRALKDLRAAEARLVDAQAAHETARANYVNAMTANLNADTDYQLLLNEYQRLINEARQDTNDFIAAATASAIDKIAKEIELRELKHQKKMVDAQKALAEAEEQLRVALRNIALACQDLTSKEKAAVIAAVQAYEAAFIIEARQEVVVLQAQRTLDSLLMVRESGAIDTSAANSTYDPSTKSYIGQVDKWKKDIKDDQAQMIIWGAMLLAMPDSLVYDDVDGWKEQIDKLTEDSVTLAYNQYQVKEEMSNYYVNYIHDGVKVFNGMIESFKKEWWDGNTEPSLSSEDSATLAKGEPKQDEFVMGNADTIDFPAYKSKGTTTTTMFETLLDNYFDTFVTPGSLDYDVNMLEYDSEEDAYFLRANQSMKEFVLGSDMATAHSQKYTFKDTAETPDKTMKWEASYYDYHEGADVKGWDYGLKGAIAVLERLNVIGEQTIASYTDSTNKYYNMWKKDRDSLAAVYAYYPSWKKTNTTAAKKKAANGGVAFKSDYGYLYGKYAPYTAAIDAYKPVKQAYDDAVTARDQQKSALITAIKTLKTEFDKVNNKSDITYNDSLAIFNALKDFAVKRQAYLGYTHGTSYLDSTKFYFGSGTDYTGKITISSVAIADMTFEDLRAKKYDKDTVLSGGALKPWAGTGDGTNAGLAGMAKQILNNEFFDAIGQDPMLFPTTIDFNANNLRALYNTYRVDSYSEPTKIYVGASGTTEYEKTVDNTALTAAENVVIAAIALYEDDLYPRFWGASSYPTGGAAEELDPKGYNDTTFTDKFPIVNFYEDGDLMFTTGLVYAIEAYAGNYTDAYEAILGEHYDKFTQDDALNSEFMKWMYWLSKKTYGTPDTNDMEDLRKWVASVEAAFEADAAAAGQPDTVSYKAAKEVYDEALANKKAFDQYLAALKEFAGYTVDEEGDTTINALFPKLSDPCGTSPAGHEFKTISDVLMSSLVKPENAFNVYPGEWAEGLGGKLLEAAQVLFPEYPLNICVWDLTIKSTDDKLIHYATLIQAAKKAYFAAAEIAGELVANKEGDKPDNWDQLVQNYKDANKRYRDRLEGIIEDLAEDIDNLEQSIAKFNAGVPQIDIAIARAENKLRVETARLEGYKQALNYAKDNLDRILDYMRGLDANFVIPEAPKTSTATI